MTSRVPFWAAGLLSLVPGAGHLAVAKYRKAAVLFVIDAGILLTLIFSGSLLIKVLMGGIYLVTMIPAAVETSLIASGRGEGELTEHPAYVVLLLLTTGFTALPLLWQSSAFSRRTKVAWTIAVPVLAFLFFTGLILFGARIDDLLRERAGASPGNP